MLWQRISQHASRPRHDSASGRITGAPVGRPLHSLAMADFIFMLTRSDQTVSDCLETIDAIGNVGVAHIGFKDVGVDMDTLYELNTRIKQAGATSYMEVVSTDSSSALRSARAATEIGVDRLLGGVDVAETLEIIGDSPIEYLPFAGIPRGHPTVLGGSPDRIASDCRKFTELGCAGVDLLAWRATEADPEDLIRAARSATDGKLVIAGSIDSPKRIRALIAAGADAFTIGTAVFDGSFSPDKGSINARLRDVLAACEAA